MHQARHASAVVASAPPGTAHARPRASTAPLLDEETEVVTRPGEAWSTVVWNDPVNLMSYVTYVFRTYFGHSRERAERLMLQVHHEGRATVSRGPREQMEVDVQAMHGFGLWATVEQVET